MSKLIALLISLFRPTPTIKPLVTAPKVAPHRVAVIPSFIDAFISTLRGELGVWENLGTNRGDGIEKYWGATSYSDGYKNRQPWCAALIAWGYLQAAIKSRSNPSLPRPRSARVFDWEAWAEANASKGVKLIKPAKSAPIKRGDIIIFGVSHIEVATADASPTELPMLLGGNTSKSGSREGKYVQERLRSRGDIRSIVRLPA